MFLGLLPQVSLDCTSSLDSRQVAGRQTRPVRKQRHITLESSGSRNVSEFLPEGVHDMTTSKHGADPFRSVVLWMLLRIEREAYARHPLGPIARRVAAFVDRAYLRLGRAED